MKEKNIKGPDIKKKGDKNKESENIIVPDYLSNLEHQINTEDKITKYFFETKDNNLKESLLSLRKSGEEFLKKTSAEIIKIFNSNKLIIKLRDIYLEKRSIKIRLELRDKNDLMKIEDYESFLRSIQSDFWGSSSNANDAIYEINRALDSLVNYFPEKTKEILELWPKLFDKKIDTGFFIRGVNIVKEKEYNVLDNKDSKMDYIKSCDDFVALMCLSDININSNDINVSEEVLRRLDSIISKYPNIKVLPKQFEKLLFEVILEKPEDIMSDSRRIDFLFNWWINNLNSLFYDRKSGSSMVPIFADRIKKCSKDESDELMKFLLEKRNSCYFSDDFCWVIELLPINKDHIKLIDKEENISDNQIIFLNKDKFLNKNIGRREYELLLESAKRLRPGNEVIFLSNLILNYPNKNLGVGESEVENILDALLNVSKERFDIYDLHTLTELMNRHYWPDNLKKKVYSVNYLKGQELNEIVAGSDNASFDWIRNNPLLLSQLQLDFHKRAQNNDLRHYFYNVLDGKLKTNNLDSLIKSYGMSNNYLDFEEIRNLFLDNRIDKKYIQYFIDKIPTSVLLGGLENQAINKDDVVWFLESAIKYGQVMGCTETFKRLILSGTIDSQEKRSDILNFLSDNILFKAEIFKNRNQGDYEYENKEIFDILFSDILSKDEASIFGKKIMNGALDLDNLESTISLVFYNCKNLEKIFPEENARREYLSKLFEKVIPNIYSQKYYLVLSSYFKNPDLFSVMGSTWRQNIENEIFSLNILDKINTLLDLIVDMNDGQKQNFIDCFEKNFKLSLVSNRNTISFLCEKLAITENFFNNQEIYKKIYKQILNDANLESEDANILFKEQIIFSDNEIRDIFFANIIRWPKINGTAILESLALKKDNKKDFSLSMDEAKRISMAIMKNRGLSPKFWNGYLTSNREEPIFYLDKELFKIGIDNIGDDCFKESPSNIVSFLDSLLKSDFEFKKEDFQIIINKIFDYSVNSDKIEVFYDYDPVLMENILCKRLNYYYNILNTRINYSEEFNFKLLNYLFDGNFHSNSIDLFLNYLQKNNNLEMVGRFKENLFKLKKEDKINGRMALLKYDFLDVVESKEFYQEITSSSSGNIRTQILDSIDVIGSMLSNRNNINQLGSFLDNPRPESIENLKSISDFIEKYSKENKGRTIAILLFAREYLPDRPLEEVIGKVSFNLRKYEQILENNSYKNIPEGFRVSIGMEYEITSSTAMAYQELTSQYSLKHDISRISQAARIGSGRDAVHEIATKPTDNPYLMLLEMKLLHDIEYIDLNFSRSENYQKGARGFHLTLGGERGLEVNQETNFLQNIILAASWGGVQSGEIGHKVNGGRGISLRNRDAGQSNNIVFFDKKTNSVELRSLSMDKQETLQRAITTAFNGAIAIQAFKECFPQGSSWALKLLEADGGQKRLDEVLDSKDKKVSVLARLWFGLLIQINKIIRRHNESFMEGEMFGYLDDDGVWIDASDFGGEYNRSRFTSIIENIDPTLSLTEYTKTTEINIDEFFKSFSVDLSDKLIKINNLYLKSGTMSSDQDKKTTIFKGDQANAISMLKTTKLSNSRIEDYDDDFLDKTIFDTAGEKRKGYYYLQGASEFMITHAVQKLLNEFNSKIEKLLN